MKDLERRCLDRTVPTGPRVVSWSGDRAGRQRPTRERREDGAMRPPAHGQLGPPELEEARRGLSLRASGGGGWPRRQPGFMLLPSRAGKNTMTNDFPLTSRAAEWFQ